jgi:hypothetical protein
MTLNVDTPGHTQPGPDRITDPRGLTAVDVRTRAEAVRAILGIQGVCGPSRCEAYSGSSVG